MLDSESTASDILMSILMLSAEKPDGITKAEIIGILATYGQAGLYDLCADEDVLAEDIEVAEDVPKTNPDNEVQPSA